MPLMPLDVQFRVLINDFLPRLHGHEIYDDTNGFINYVQNGTPKMPHRGYLLHYYILGSVKQFWLTSYKGGVGFRWDINTYVLYVFNKQDKNFLRVAENLKGSSVGSKLQCSDVTIIISHLSLAMCHVWGPGVSWLLHSCTPLLPTRGQYWGCLISDISTTQDFSLWMSDISLVHLCAITISFNLCLSTLALSGTYSGSNTAAVPC